MTLEGKEMWLRRNESALEQLRAEFQEMKAKLLRHAQLIVELEVRIKQHLTRREQDGKEQEI